jgi:hypothetical protein
VDAFEALLGKPVQAVVKNPRHGQN